MELTNLLFYFAPIIGLGTLVIGILAVLRPQPMSKKFGIAATHLTLPYVVSTGIRDVFMGLTVLILFYNKNWTLLGLINFCISIVAVSDFLVVLKHGEKKTSFIHLFGAVLVTAYGIWLACQ
ncbi:MAG: DUF4267 domain-containing protein [Bdellovibrionota bacterium]